MKVMTNHQFFDEEVQKVNCNYGDNVREICLDTGSLLLNRKDVIALAKEFDLVVFDRDDQL